MSVYLKDGLVLLDSDLVAVNTACCCGCTDCAFLFPPLSDGMGNCYASEQCDGFHDPVPCNTWFYTDNEYCVGDDFSCNVLCHIVTIDPVTCEQIIVFDGNCSDLGGGLCGVTGQGTVHTYTDQAVLCMGACCLLGVCSIQTHIDCFNAGGFYQGAGTDCDPDPC